MLSRVESSRVARSGFFARQVLDVLCRLRVVGGVRFRLFKGADDARERNAQRFEKLRSSW
jgi:hypothetical protein